jgi:hypothetical protein
MQPGIPPIAPNLGNDEAFLFHPWSLPMRIVISVLFIALMAGVAFTAAIGARDVDLDADHGAGMLVITRTDPLRGTSRESIPLAAVRGTVLAARRAKNGRRVYGVELELDTGEDLEISSVRQFQGRQGQKRAIDAFLADPGAPPLHLRYDQGHPAMLALLGIIPLLLLVIRGFWLGARVRLERWRGQLWLERSRWPLARWSRSFSAGEIRQARVDDKRGSKGGRVYRVILVLASGEEVPLLKVWGNAVRPHREAAEWINARLS